MLDPMPREDVNMPPTPREAALIGLLRSKDYIRLRARYDAGQLSFVNQIDEMEMRALGYILEKEQQNG
jgi:hypothetical protein